MSTELVLGPAPVPVRDRRVRAFRVVGWLLLACCLAILGATAVEGERAASYGDLLAAVADGHVDEVRVSEGLPEGSRGFSTAEVHWRDGLVGRVAEVVEVSPRDSVDESQVDAPIIEGQIDDVLLDLDPGLSVTRSGELTSYSTLGSWRAPDWAVLLSFLVWVGAVGLLAFGPEPWRATPWAWFWLLWLAWPLGLLAMLLLSGATVRLRPARPGRLTGGWAFLILVFGGAAASAVAAALV